MSTMQQPMPARGVKLKEISSGTCTIDVNNHDCHEHLVYIPSLSYLPGSNEEFTFVMHKMKKFTIFKRLSTLYKSLAAKYNVCPCFIFVAFNIFGERKIHIGSTIVTDTWVFNQIPNYRFEHFTKTPSTHCVHTNPAAASSFPSSSSCQTEGDDRFLNRKRNKPTTTTKPMSDQLLNIAHKAGGGTPTTLEDLDLKRISIVNHLIRLYDEKSFAILCSLFENAGPLVEYRTVLLSSGGGTVCQNAMASITAVSSSSSSLSSSSYHQKVIVEKQRRELAKLLGTLRHIMATSKKTRRVKSFMSIDESKIHKSIVEYVAQLNAAEQAGTVDYFVVEHEYWYKNIRDTVTSLSKFRGQKSPQFSTPPMSNLTIRQQQPSSLSLSSSSTRNNYCSLAARMYEAWQVYLYPAFNTGRPFIEQRGSSYCVIPSMPDFLSRPNANIGTGCRHTNVRTESVHLRAADEGDSVFDVCMDCGHVFSIKN